MIIVSLLLGRWLLLAILLSFSYFCLRLPLRQIISLGIITVCAGVLALLLAKLAGEWFYNPRPFDVDHTVPVLIQKHLHDNGFPSYHALLAFLLSGLAFVKSKRVGAIMFIMSLGVVMGRLLGKVHHLIDFAGSLIIAAIAVAFAYLFLKLLIKAFPRLPNI